MRSSTQYLNDEHMLMYKWSGAGTAAGWAVPQKPKRTHAWHASYEVLAVMTTLLLLNGCDNKGSAEQSGVQIGQAAPDMKEKMAPLNEEGMAEDSATQAGPAREADRALDEAREKLEEKIEHGDENLPKL